MTSGIYPLNRGRWADRETDKVRAYLANLRIVSLRATPHRRRAYSAFGAAWRCVDYRIRSRAVMEHRVGGLFRLGEP